MRAVVVVVLLVGCGAAPAAPPETPAPKKSEVVAAPAPSNELPLHWVGEWTSLAEQVTFSFDIRLTPPKGGHVTGRIFWTLLSVPPEHFLASRVNDSGTEFVKGTWSSEQQLLHLVGTSVDSTGFLVVDEYKLHLAVDHESFDGRTRGSKGDWMNSIRGRRAD
jgi:hypothetical protein